MRRIGRAAPAFPEDMPLKHSVCLAFACLLTALPDIALSADWQAELELTAKHFRFDEFDGDADRLVREQGVLPGFGVTGGYRHNDWDIALGAKVYSGDIDYDGQTQSGQPFESETDESMYELDFVSRYLLYRLQSKPVSLYALFGVGTRLWERNIKGGGNVTGLDETYSWHMIYAGTALDYTAAHGNRFALDARVTRNINPQVEIDFNRSFDDATLNLGHRYGFRFTAAWMRTLSAGTAFAIDAFLEHWRFGASSTEPLTNNGLPIGSVFQPKSETREIGIGARIMRHW